jgi:hypothetical protein
MADIGVVESCSIGSHCSIEPWAPSWPGPRRKSRVRAGFRYRWQTYPSFRRRRTGRRLRGGACQNRAAVARKSKAESVRVNHLVSFFVSVRRLCSQLFWWRTFEPQRTILNEFLRLPAVPVNPQFL